MFRKCFMYLKKRPLCKMPFNNTMIHSEFFKLQLNNAKVTCINQGCTRKNEYYKADDHNKL